MSIWTILAWGAKVSVLPVTRSSKRTPMAIDQIALADGHVGPIGAVHADHAQPQGIGARKCAQPHQGGRHRDLGRAGELGQLLGSALRG